MSETAPIILVSPDMRPSVMGVARSLTEANLLQRFVTTVAVGNGNNPTAFRYLPPPLRERVQAKFNGREIPGFLKVPVETFPSRELLVLAGRRAGFSDVTSHHLWEWAETSFDHKVAARWAGRAPVIYGCEHASVETFRKQKEAGGLNILWQVTAHHSLVDGLLREEYEKFPEALTSYQQHLFKVIGSINARKDEQYGHADLIVTNSEFSRRTFIQAGIPARKVVAVPTGCPRPREAPVGEIHKDSKIIFLNAGNQTLQKGTSYLLEAWKSLSATDHAELWMVGNMGLASNQLDGMPHNLRMIPRVSRPELRNFFERASVLVLPTLCEGRAHIILEAIAAGLAVITTENSGCGDLVENGVNGWKVPIRDAAALADRISWCLERPEEVEKMKQQSLIKAENWQVGDFVREHSELINSFLKSSGLIGEASCAA